MHIQQKSRFPKRRHQIDRTQSTVKLIEHDLEHECSNTWPKQFSSTDIKWPISLFSIAVGWNPTFAVGKMDLAHWQTADLQPKDLGFAPCHMIVLIFLNYILDYTHPMIIKTHYILHYSVATLHFLRDLCISTSSPLLLSGSAPTSSSMTFTFTKVHDLYDLHLHRGARLIWSSPRCATWHTKINRLLITC